MSVAQKQLKKEIKRLVRGCMSEADGFRDCEKFAELKRKCKQSESSIDILYRFLKVKFRDARVDTRVCALNLADEFFMRSHHFRTLLLDEFNDLVDCVLDVRIDTLLGDSREAVRELRKLAVRLLRKWQSQFGDGYPQLANVFDYLRYSKRLVISDEDGAVITRGDIRERLERERRNEQVAMRKLAAAQATFTEFCSALNDSHAELDSLVQIFRASHSNSCSNAVEVKDSTIEVTETDDNAELLELFLRHRYKLENEYVVKLQAVIRSISSYLSYENVAAFARELIETKTRVENSVREAKALRVLRDTTRFRASRNYDAEEQSSKAQSSVAVANDAESDDDDDFIEVRQDGRVDAPSRPAELPTSSREQPSAVDDEAWEIDADTLNRLQSSTHSADRGKRVTVCKRDNTYWARCDATEVELPETSMPEQRCVYTFVGRFEPITRCCNAPLAPWSPEDGGQPKLCPRRDRVKCPFHGPIIDRDEFGQPVTAVDAASASASSSQSTSEPSTSTDAASSLAFLDRPSTSTGQRESLTAAISGAIRDDLGNRAQQLIAREMESSRKRKREKAETARDRLSDKVLNRRALSRTGQVQDHLLHMRNSKRFAHQFNYQVNS